MYQASIIKKSDIQKFADLMRSVLWLNT